MLLYSIWKSVKRNLLNIKWNQTTCGSMPSQIKSLTAIYTAWKFHIFNNLKKSDKQKIKSINSLLAFLALLSSRMFFAMQNPLILFWGVVYFNQNDKAGVSNQKVLTIFVLVDKRILGANVYNYRQIKVTPYS